MVRNSTNLKNVEYLECKVSISKWLVLIGFRFGNSPPPPGSSIPYFYHHVERFLMVCICDYVSMWNHFSVHQQISTLRDSESVSLLRKNTTFVSKIRAIYRDPCECGFHYWAFLLLCSLSEQVSLFKNGCPRNQIEVANVFNPKALYPLHINFHNLTDKLTTCARLFLLRNNKTEEYTPINFVIGYLKEIEHVKETLS